MTALGARWGIKSEWCFADLTPWDWQNGLLVICEIKSSIDIELYRDSMDVEELS